MAAVVAVVVVVVVSRAVGALTAAGVVLRVGPDSVQVAVPAHAGLAWGSDGSHDFAVPDSAGEHLLTARVVTVAPGSVVAYPGDSATEEHLFDFWGPP